ncbi:MAG: elongation factor P [Acidobacteriota bacterium]
MQATGIRRGMVILHNNSPHRVVEFRHHTPGNLRAMVQTKLRNLRSGSMFEHRFRSTDTVERASLEQHEMEYLYSDAAGHHFMNTENYEQLTLDEETLGDGVLYLSPGFHVHVDFFEGRAIALELPAVVELRVVSTEPEMKGATISNVMKPAKLETGVIVQVPPFIKEGEVIRVDPTEGRYLERAK